MKTGIEKNMRPLIRKSKKLFRAQREIGYGGTVAVKKRTYKINTPTTGSILSFQTILLNLKE
jgi:hypothetical protein